jgi:hypothetical protein
LVPGSIRVLEQLVNAKLDLNNTDIDAHPHSILFMKQWRVHPLQVIKYH